MKILIVDDSKAMRMIVRRTLRKSGFRGHDFSEACNGAEALEAIKSECPDLVLSDWNMPVMDGYELLQSLKQLDDGPKFGFVTSEFTQEMRDQAADAGALFLITKPFTPESFLLALDPVLS